MSATGPELPPHLLAKRKRQQEEARQNEEATASGANTQDKRQRTQGPESPPSPLQPAGPRLPSSAESPASPAPRRVVGPAPPPAPLDERPSEPADANDSESDSDDNDDDDFGPSLPSAADLQPPSPSAASEPTPSVAPAAKRDEWMTLPPQQDDLAARMDPSKLRSRGFNTGKSARGGKAAPTTIGAAWTETPEQKLKRLQDEAMGVTAAPMPGAAAKDAARSQEREAEARRLRAQTDKIRGPSLMERHQKTNPQEKEDDPSKRAFDREKDMGAGGRLGHAQKKEMLNKASDFSSKFSGGGYL